MREKTVGYLLLFFSIIVIIGTIINVYLVFIGRTAPVDVFGSLGSLDLAPGMTLGNQENNLSTV